MSDAIKLQLINQSNDNDNSQIVIFQRNVAPGFNELAVAWRVIHATGVGDTHPFTLPVACTVAVSDSFGNDTPQQLAHPGELFRVVSGTAGTQLVADGNATIPTQIQVRNDLKQGAINVSIYKDGRLLASKTSVAPQQLVVFEFNPSIWIGAVSDIIEGQIMNSAILSTLQTELALLGITAANIIMTSGGPGRNASAVQFTLANVVRG